MSRKSIFVLLALIPRVMISYVFSASLPTFVTSLYASRTDFYILGGWSLVATVIITVDVLLQRTWPAFFAGVVALAIFAFNIFFILWPFLKGTVNAMPYSRVSFALLIGFYVILISPFLAGLVLGGREPEKLYIPALCGIAVWTSLYNNLELPPIWQLHWNYIIIYVIGAVVSAFLAIGGHHVRVKLEKYFVESGEERRWRKAINREWDR